jgi:hypothetical protein
MSVIRASEIGEYVFCHRAWWLRRVQGHESVNVREMALGAGTHAQHGRTVGAARALQTLALVLAVAAIVFFVVSSGQ